MSDSGEARLGGARRICRQPLRPGLRDLWERFGVKALSRIGCLSSGRGLEKRRMPQLVQVKPLGILLWQADNAASLHCCRNAELVPPGEEPVLQSLWHAAMCPCHAQSSQSPHGPEQA